MLRCSDSLIEISPSEWISLLELYSEKRTQSTGYYVIKNYIKWIEKEPDLNIKCLTLDKDWLSDGTFIIIVNNNNVNKDVFLNTLNDSNLNRLTQLLLSITDDPKGYTIYGYAERLLPVVEAYKKKFENFPLITAQTAWYRASRELVDSFQIDPPTGIELHSLRLEDAATINAVWPHRVEGSIEFVKRLIKHNVSVGAYDGNGKLLAWCLRLPSGSLGLLQVQDSQKRLGLGSLMVRCLSKQIAAMNEEVLAPVVTENAPSRGMFHKLGFQQIDNVYWTIY